MECWLHNPVGSVAPVQQRAESGQRRCLQLRGQPEHFTPFPFDPLSEPKLEREYSGKLDDYIRDCDGFIVKRGYLFGFYAISASSASSNGQPGAALHR